MATPKKKNPKPTCWRISVIRKKGEHLGTVEAASADEAIKIAIRTWGITDPERQRRLIARRLDS